MAPYWSDAIILPLSSKVIETHDPSPFADGPYNLSAWNPSGNFRFVILGSFGSWKFSCLDFVKETNNTNKKIVVITKLMEVLFLFIFKIYLIYDLIFSKQFA